MKIAIGFVLSFNLKASQTHRSQICSSLVTRQQCYASRSFWVKDQSFLS